MQPAHEDAKGFVHALIIQSLLMVHEILPVGMLQCNCSIFGDEQSGDALVIDPGDNLPRSSASWRATACT